MSATRGCPLHLNAVAQPGADADALASDVVADVTKSKPGQASTAAALLRMRMSGSKHLLTTLNTLCCIILVAAPARRNMIDIATRF